MSYLSEVGAPTSPLVKVPPQDTSKAAASIVQPQEPGSEFNPPPPRPVQDILDDLNAVRTELGELLAARDREHRKGGGPGNPYPIQASYRPLTTEGIKRDKQIDELQDKESELMDEFRTVKELMIANEGGKPFSGTADQVIGEDRVG